MLAAEIEAWVEKSGFFKNMPFSDETLIDVDIDDPEYDNMIDANVEYEKEWEKVHGEFPSCPIDNVFVFKDLDETKEYCPQGLYKEVVGVTD